MKYKTFFVLFILIMATGILLWTGSDRSQSNTTVEYFGNMTRVTLESPTARHVEWTANGHLIFEQDSWICVIGPNGDDFNCLVPGCNPVVSTDGTEIYFLSLQNPPRATPGESQQTEVLALNLDGNGLRDLRSIGKVVTIGSHGNVMPGPDGKRVAIPTHENVIFQEQSYSYYGTVGFV